MSEPAKKRDRMEIVKATIPHFICKYLHVLLPTPGNPSAVSLYTDDTSNIVVVDTEAMRLLHDSSFVQFKLSLKLQPLVNLIQSPNKDAAAIGRYALRTTNPRRDILFHFRFSDRELDCVANGNKLSSLSSSSSSSSSTTYTDFMWCLCPLDVMIGSRTLNAARDIAYDVVKSHRTNESIIQYLQTVYAKPVTQQDVMKTLIACGTQLGEYRTSIVSTASAQTKATVVDEPVCQLIVARDSKLHNALIGVFCEVTNVYDAAKGRTFVSELAFMHEQSAILLSPRDALHTHAISPQTKQLAVDRHRVLMLRASLDQLGDAAAVDQYVHRGNEYLDRLRGQRYESMDDEYVSLVSEQQHLDNIDRAIDSYKKAWSNDGFVCGMVNFMVDPQYHTLYILDVCVHPLFVRKLRVMAAIRKIIREIISDGEVARMVVIAPVHMTRDVALPVYDAIFGGDEESLRLSHTHDPTLTPSIQVFGTMDTSSVRE